MSNGRRVEEDEKEEETWHPSVHAYCISCKLNASSTQAQHKRQSAHERLVFFALKLKPTVPQHNKTRNRKGAMSNKRLGTQHTYKDSSNTRKHTRKNRTIRPSCLLRRFRDSWPSQVAAIIPACFITCAILRYAAHHLEEQHSCGVGEQTPLLSCRRRQRCRCRWRCRWC